MGEPRVSSQISQFDADWTVSLRERHRVTHPYANRTTRIGRFRREGWQVVGNFRAKGIGCQEMILLTLPRQHQGSRNRVKRRNCLAHARNWRYTFKGRGLVFSDGQGCSHAQFASVGLDGASDSSFRTFRSSANPNDAASYASGDASISSNERDT